MSASIRTADTLADLARAAHERPVVSPIDELDARLLKRKHGIEVIDSYEKFCSLFESPDHAFTSDVVIRDTTTDLNLNRSLTTYTPPEVDRIKYTGTVYDDTLNSLVREGWLSWEDVRNTTLCQSQIAERIVKQAETADVVVLVIVDGLSYKDWTDAGHDADPVYVDCPTITKCGYPNVVYGGPTGDHLAARLFKRGFSARLAFTYWEAGENELTDRLHPDFSDNDIIGDVENFNDVISYLQSNNWYHDPVYLQITLTGPERVAHKMKEEPTVSAEIDEVYRKVNNISNTLSEIVPSFQIFATADHGILWRKDVGEELTVVDGNWEHYNRRCITDISVDSALPQEYGHRENWDGTEYLRLNYPYLFSDLRSNEPGTHGGFSFEESIVPLINLQHI